MRDDSLTSRTDSGRARASGFISLFLFNRVVKMSAASRSISRQARCVVCGGSTTRALRLAAQLQTPPSPSSHTRGATQIAHARQICTSRAHIPTQSSSVMSAEIASSSRLARPSGLFNHRFAQAAAIPQQLGSLSPTQNATGQTRRMSSSAEKPEKVRPEMHF